MIPEHELKEVFKLNSMLPVIPNSATLPVKLSNPDGKTNVLPEALDRVLKLPQVQLLGAQMSLRFKKCYNELISSSRIGMFIIHLNSNTSNRCTSTLQPVDLINVPKIFLYVIQRFVVCICLEN